MVLVATDELKLSEPALSFPGGFVPQKKCFQLPFLHFRDVGFQGAKIGFRRRFPAEGLGLRR